MAPRPAPARPPRPSISTPTTRPSPASIRPTRPPTAPMMRAPSSALAIAQAGSAELGRDQGGDPQGASIRAARRSMPARTSSPRRCGLIKDGKPIKYEGVIGPVTFDQYGDITGPVPAVADQERRGDDGRRDVHRRCRRHQGEDRALEPRRTLGLPPRKRGRTPKAVEGIRPLPRPPSAAWVRKGGGRRSHHTQFYIPRSSRLTPERTELAPGLYDQPHRHRPVAGRRHGARRAAARPRRRGGASSRAMPRPASTPSTWPTTTAAPRISPAASTRSSRQARCRAATARRPPSPSGARRPARWTATRARRRRAAASTRLGVAADRPAAVPLVELRASRPISTRLRELAALQREGLDRAISASPTSTPTICASLVEHGIPVASQPGLLLAARPARRRRR